MKYAGDLVAFDGEPRRTRRKAFNIPAGKHVLTIKWSNWQVPEFAAVDSSGEGLFCWVGGGVSDVEIDAEAGRFYEVTWPYDDEPGGPTGFLDVSSRR
jgi:hypothetical protein